MSADGLHLLVLGVPEPVTATDLARWIAMGRGGPLRLDLAAAEMIMAGCAMELRWRTPRPRPGDDR